jgi:hypothetical protein
MSVGLREGDGEDYEKIKKDIKKETSGRRAMLHLDDASSAFFLSSLPHRSPPQHASLPYPTPNTRRHKREIRGSAPSGCSSLKERERDDILGLQRRRRKTKSKINRREK